MSVWESAEEPAVVCPKCNETVSRAVIRQLFILRRQVRQIHGDVEELSGIVLALRQDVDELHQELTEMVAP